MFCVPVWVVGMLPVATSMTPSPFDLLSATYAVRPSVLVAMPPGYWLQQAVGGTYDDGIGTTRLAPIEPSGLTEVSATTPLAPDDRNVLPSGVKAAPSYEPA